VQKEALQRSEKKTDRGWTAQMLLGRRSDGPEWLIVVKAPRRCTNYTFRLDLGVCLGARSRGSHANVDFLY
jgi:hypothetical protein